jgi:flagellar hook protein FlgE
MSLFGSMTTAISGMTAQSRALSNISENVANSQTVGFKRLDTSFEDLLGQASGKTTVSGAVAASVSATNGIQGSIEQVESPLSLALAGRGFFSVARPATREADGTVVFDPRETFSRAGDFAMDQDGFLVNGSGYALQGWAMREDGTPDRTALAPIRINDSIYQPAPSTQITLSANLPATPPAAEMATTTQVYDGLGTQQPVRLGWTQLSANTWRLAVSAPGATTPDLGGIDVQFGGNGAPAGTISGLANGSGALAGTAFAPGGPAAVDLSADFGNGAQPLRINLGRFATADGLTQYSGTDYELRSVAQDGAPPGAFSSVTVRDDGDVVVNYDNGQSRTLARVPVVTFADPDALERLDGQAFGRTAEAGAIQVTDPGRNGAGQLNAGAVERSNVDIAAEFSKLIVAQRAYTANTRVVTTSDEMLQETLNMRR